jgi:hypothetical protein
MSTCYDHTHVCPQCGSAWKICVVSVVTGARANGITQFRIVVSSESCSDPECSISPAEVAAFRATRRQRGWDRWLTSTG